MVVFSFYVFHLPCCFLTIFNNHLNLITLCLFCISWGSNVTGFLSLTNLCLSFMPYYYLRVWHIVANCNMLMWEMILFGCEFVCAQRWCNRACTNVKTHTVHINHENNAVSFICVLWYFGSVATYYVGIIQGGWIPVKSFTNNSTPADM